MRFSGNSLHFLEEEKFRRRFGHRYPELREGLIDAIASREASERQRFIYHGKELRESLLGLQGQSVGLVRVPGDLSVMADVVQVLNIDNHHNHGPSNRGAPSPTAQPAA